MAVTKSSTLYKFMFKLHT